MSRPHQLVRLHLGSFRKGGGGMGQNSAGRNDNLIWIPVENLQKRCLFGANDRLSANQCQTSSRGIRWGQEHPSRRIITATPFSIAQRHQHLGTRQDLNRDIDQRLQVGTASLATQR
ncbi:unnamed protein product [Lampetra planeri]